MSSRALRKAQKQREEEEALKRLQEEADNVEESDEDVAPVKPQKSAFALLNEDDEGSGENGNEADEAEPEVADDGASDEAEKLPRPTSSSKRKKNKKKKRAKPVVETERKDDEIDDIDAALKELRASDEASGATVVNTEATALSQTCRLLAVESQNLHAENEMRRLFGRTALENNDRDEQAGQGRRRGRNQQMAGLAAALGRRQGAQGGRSSGLGLLGLRRNLFIQGKEEWPIGTSGGLAMEVVEKREDGTILYRFTHNSAYQEVQGDFDVCVRAMDPERMIRLLQMNPYHISTLLQVSEIAKQERDNATSGDLLERALFTFGRSLHSTFANSLAQGKARLDFRRPENREFWLAVSRYIGNLSLRATWRTVFEWAKLLLSLDPEHDPYCLYLVIDQYALRSRQPQALIDMAANEVIGKGWADLPNIQLSLGLALVQIGQTSKGKQALFKAANKFPWVVARLFQELNVDAPPGIWGKSSRTDWEKLCTELYAVRAKDVWNTPESSNLLVEVSAAVAGGAEPSIPERAITIDEGRHVILSDKPELIAHLPRSISGQLKGASDPLPPDDSISSYQIRASPGTRRAMGGGPPRNEAIEEMRALYESFSQLDPDLVMRMQGIGGENGQGGTEAEMEQLLRGSGMSLDEFARRARRFTELHEALIGPLARGDDELGDMNEED
ncbi:Transcriptional repressor TCF25-like protein [Elsinoe fawcettii]|nr:Transcriptional repressor TCF25-like protein [Elsinoe fawcettii]